MDKINKRLSIVIPVYNESENIRELYARLIRAQEAFLEPFEIILVNDGSKDNTLEIIKDIASTDKNIKAIDLSRNFGHQLAIKAGLSFFTAQAAIVMDADLQDGPEIIEQFVRKWQEGYDVVYAIRINRKENILLRFLYASFYRLLKMVSNIQIPLDAGDFCLLDKKIAKILVSLSEQDPFIRGLRSWIGYRQTGIECPRHGRFGGRSKYTTFKLFKLALDGIVSFSVIPLKIATFFGFLISAYAFFTITTLFFNRMPIKGTTTITVLILLLGGVQLISIGILGEYIGRIYEQSKQRPLFLIKDTINI